MFKEPKYEELLFHYLSGDVSDKQKKDIYDWINQSEENRAYFNEIRTKYLIMVQISKVDLITRTNFGEVLNKINSRKNLRRVSFSVTAFVFLLFFSVTFLMNNRNEPFIKEALVSNVVNVKPGTTEAILQLSTGEEIEVNKLSGEIIKDGLDVDIKVDKDGVISYNNQTKELKQIQYNTLFVPKGGEYTISLSDGTIVKLNSYSKLKYPVEFIGDERKVYLEGEAFFDVSHNKNKPFFVEVNNVTIKVLGTSFNINSNSANVIETVLVEGKVELTVDNSKEFLLPNNRAIVSDNNISIDIVDVEPYIAWTRGEFVFYNESLYTIMNKLSLWYNFDVVYIQDEVMDYKLTGEMQRCSEIQDVLYFFEKSSDLKFEINNNQILVSKL